MNITETATKRQAKALKWISLVLAVGAGGGALFCLQAAIRSSAWQLYTGSACLLAVSLVAILFFQNIRRGQRLSSAGLWVAVIPAVALITSILFSNTGSLAGLTSLLLVILISTLSITNLRSSSAIIMASALAGMVAGFFSIFGTPFQLQVGNPESIQGLIIILTCICFVILICLIYPTIPISQKILAAFLTTTLIVSLIFIVVTEGIITARIGIQLGSLIQMLLVTSMAILLLATGLAFRLARSLALPIQQLDQAATRAASGDFSLRLNLNRQDELGQLGESFNRMTAYMQDTLDSLEKRVSDRTRDMDISAQISRRLSNVLDEKQLVTEVVEQLGSSYHYYHVHIYLFEPSHQSLVMVAGTGEAGQELVHRQHQLERGKGMVGRAAETNSIALAPDVSQFPGWLPNPLLPNTRSEIAVPISLGEDVLGVLDVQEDEIGGLKLVDAELIQSIANQVAIALQNARLFSITQREAENEVLINAISRQIEETTSIPDALQVAVRELGRALKAQRTSIKISNR